MKLLVSLGQLSEVALDKLRIVADFLYIILQVLRRVDGDREDTKALVTPSVDVKFKLSLSVCSLLISFLEHLQNVLASWDVLAVPSVAEVGSLCLAQISNFWGERHTGWSSEQVCGRPRNNHAGHGVDLVEDFPLVACHLQSFVGIHGERLGCRLQALAGVSTTRLESGFLGET